VRTKSITDKRERKPAIILGYLEVWFKLYVLRMLPLSYDTGIYQYFYSTVMLETIFRYY